MFNVSYCSVCVSQLNTPTPCDPVSCKASPIILGRLTLRTSFCWRRFPHQWQPPRMLEHPCNRLSAPVRPLLNGRRGVTTFTAHHVCGGLVDPRPLHRPVSIERCLLIIPPEISQLAVYHVEGRRTALANLIRVESRRSHDDQYSFPTSLPSCAHEEALADASGHPLERQNSHPATLVPLWPRLAMCLFGRRPFELNHAGDKGLAPSTKFFPAENRKSLANGRFTFRSSLHKRNRPQRRVVACRVEMWALDVSSEDGCCHL